MLQIFGMLNKNLSYAMKNYIKLKYPSVYHNVYTPFTDKIPCFLSMIKIHVEINIT